MAQTRIFGLREELVPIRSALSDTIHSCVVDALSYPPDKRFHRFFPLEREDFVHPADRSDRYTIIEISMFEGRSAEAKRTLIRLLFQRIHHNLGIDPQDVEITLFESPMQNWGLRGAVGDEIALPYSVNV
ncbi:MAG: tautomerase family protein [Chloroflexota bacterium]|nr:tautomerase family protein [Chloroflexota bacterium]MDE2884438.1 tautomerase family protein [Chloroflexota bacterium]